MAGAGPVAAAGTGRGLIGTLVSLVQALTQIQEQTLGFVAKLVAVVVVLFATSGWLGGELYRFAEMTLLKVPLVR